MTKTHNNNGRVVVCSGFHRSATSAVARYLSSAGLNMGHQLMSADISNPGGHYEDIPVVNLHETALRQCGSTWQYSGSKRLQTIPQEMIRKYVAARDSKDHDWGFKDPRTILFLDSWGSALGDRACFLFVARHWSECVESILHRHSRILAHNLPSNFEMDLNFWMHPALPAQMWLAYNKALLNFLDKNKKNRLVVTHRSVLRGLPLIDEVNKRFSLQLDGKVVSPVNSQFSGSRVSKLIEDQISGHFRSRLDVVWERLLEHADHTSVNEEIQTYCPVTVSNPLANRLATLAGDIIKNSDSSKNIGVEDILTGLDRISNLDQLCRLLKRAEKSRIFANLEISKSLYRLLHLKFSTVEGAYKAAAQYLYLSGKYRKALEYFKQAFLLGKPEPHYFSSIAKCYAEIENATMATCFFDKAIQADPQNFVFYCEKADFLRANGQSKEAFSLYRHALQSKPLNARVVLMGARALEESDRVDEALKALVTFRESGNTHAGIENRYVKLLLARDYNLGQRAYKDMMRTKAESGKREKYLTTLLHGVTSSSAEKDLLSRVEQHWLALDS